MFWIWNIPKFSHEPVSFATHVKRLDPVGMLFLVPSIVSLLLALQLGGSVYPWSNPRIIVLFVLFGVLILAFAAVQIFMPETATVPARVITHRSIFCASIYTFFVAGSMMIMIYYIPIWCKVLLRLYPKHFAKRCS